MAEGGQKFGKEEETYFRQALTLRSLDPLALFQFSTEESKRGGSEYAVRLNAAARFALADTEHWKLTVGTGIGGVVSPSGNSVPRDYGGEISLGYVIKPAWSTEKLRTGIDLGATSRPADPFSASQGSLFSLKAGFSLLDFIKVSVEYYDISGEPVQLNLPRSDVRFLISPGPGLFYFK